ncbi:MAG: hypothetical protein WC712_13380 [Candidatus Brocadiia bacterium]
MSEHDPIMVPQEVKYPCGWISWVSAVSGCLTALGRETDQVEVAGRSGYAFHSCIAPDLCPSGPTMLGWGLLAGSGVLLGRTVKSYMSGECHTPEKRNERTAKHCREAFEFAKSEIDAGRPCVLWGANIPEFAIAVGHTDDCYIVKNCFGVMGRPEPPVKFDELNAPGGMFVLGFPQEVEGWCEADRYALAVALQMFRRETFSGHDRYGRAAYTFWADRLKSGTINYWSNSYNVVCTTEGRRFAAEFVKRVSLRNGKNGERLAAAVPHYEECAGQMAKLAELFPFNFIHEPITDKEKIGAACDALANAEVAEAAAFEVIRNAVLDWERKA